MTEMRNATKAPLAEGQQISYSPRDGIVITLQHVRPGVYSVLTMAGAERLDDWSRSYATEVEARSAARHVALLFQGYANTEAVDAARREIETKRYRALNSRAAWAARVIEETGAQLDGMMTLADRAAYLGAIAG